MAVPPTIGTAKIIREPTGTPLIPPQDHVVDRTSPEGWEITALCADLRDCARGPSQASAHLRYGAATDPRNQGKARLRRDEPDLRRGRRPRDRSPDEGVVCSACRLTTSDPSSWTDGSLLRHATAHWVECESMSTGGVHQ